MRAMINRVFSRAEMPSHFPSGHSTVSSEFAASDIESYYLTIIVDCLRRMLVPADQIEVTVERSGTGPVGQAAFAGYVRILKWDPVFTPVLLQNMTVIDARIRKIVGASFILKGTDFAGLWFQASSSTQGSPTSLRGLPCELVHRPGGD